VDTFAVLDVLAFLHVNGVFPGKQGVSLRIVVPLVVPSIYAPWNMLPWSRKRHPFAMPSRKYFIGIDFGTTNSLAAWGLLSPKGRSITPQVVRFALDETGASMESMGSSIYFEEGRRQAIVGRRARRLGRRCLSRFVPYPKKLLGTQETFAVDGTPYKPSDLVAMVLRRLRLQLQKDLNARITGAILTTPASFGYARRKDLINAASLAGLAMDEHALLDEPVAALLSYIHMEKRRRISQRILDPGRGVNLMILDCGGGTTDATIARLEDTQIGSLSQNVHLLSISRFEALGGQDFDREICFLLQDTVERMSRVETDRLDPEEKECLEAELLYQSEQLKLDFSSLEMDAEAEGIQAHPHTLQTLFIRHPSLQKPVRVKLSYGDFLNAIQGLLDPSKDRSIHRPVQTALERGKLRPKDLHHLLIVGGMSKLWTLRKSLEKALGLPALQVLHPTQSVVKGAVFQHFAEISDLSRAPHVPQISGEAIRLRLRGGSTETIVPEGVKLPYETVLRGRLCTARNGQKQLTISLCAGDRIEYEANQHLGTGILDFGMGLEAEHPIGLRAVMRSDRMIVVEAFLENNPEVRTVMTAGLGLMAPEEVEQRKEEIFPSRKTRR